MIRPGEQDAVEHLQNADVVQGLRGKWEGATGREARVITAAVYPIIAAAVLRAAADELLAEKGGSLYSAYRLRSSADAYERGDKA